MAATVFASLLVIKLKLILPQRVGAWSISAYSDFVTRNSESIDGRRIDVEQNNRIGAILGLLSGAAPPARP